MSKIINILNKAVDVVVVIALAIMLVYGMYSIYDVIKVATGSKLSNKITKYKPDSENNSENFSKLREYNENIFAWIELDNTKIDYPVVKGTSNSEYINKGYDERFSISGAIFLDYRNNINLTDAYSIIYGHHMDSNLLFGDLDRYKDEDFFNKNKTGRIYLEDRKIEVEIFACMISSSYDNKIFTVNKNTLAQKQDLINHIKNNALYYRNITLDEDTRILALATCSSDITSGRLIVFAKII